MWSDAAFAEINTELSALERYRRAAGTTPLTLQELVPANLAKVPHDVMDGAPLRYCPEVDGSYVLYSIAMNARGDGAAVGKRLAVPGQLDWI